MVGAPVQKLCLLLLSKLVFGALLALDSRREADTVHRLERLVNEVRARPLLVREGVHLKIEEEVIEEDKNRSINQSINQAGEGQNVNVRQFEERDMSDER